MAHDFNHLLEATPENFEEQPYLDGTLNGRRVVGIAGEPIKKGDTIWVPLNGKSFSNKIFKARD